MGTKFWTWPKRLLLVGIMSMYNGLIMSTSPLVFWARPIPRARGGGTPIYFLYRGVPTVRVSFSGSSVLNRVYNFTFSCLKQGRPHKSPPFLPLRSHNFHWFRRNAWKRKLICTVLSVLNMACLVQSWTEKEIIVLSLRQGSKIYIFVSWTGSGFRWVGRTPLPKFLLSTPPRAPGLLHVSYGANGNGPTFCVAGGPPPLPSRRTSAPLDVRIFQKKV